MVVGHLGEMGTTVIFEEQDTQLLDIPYLLLYHVHHKRVKHIGVSFNGRTADSGSADWGSNPCTPAQEKPFLVSPFLCSQA